MKGIVQSLVREVKKYTKAIDADVDVTNEKIGVLEATQLATDTKLGTMEPSITRIDKSGGAFYVQQQQQASSCCHKFSKSNAFSDKEYPSTRRVYCIVR
jgi:hypothetical protein